MSDPDPPSGFPRWLKWGLLGALAVLVLGYGAIFLYAEVLNDSPDEFDGSDLGAALADGATGSDLDAAPADGATGSDLDAALADGATGSDLDAAPADGATGSAPVPDPAATPGSVSPATVAAATTEPPGDAIGRQTWTITDASEVGYRVKEVLFGVDAEGVGRTNEITGDIVIEGTQVVAGGFVVDVASIESDDGRRDGQFRGRIMSTDEFPEATFVLTEPIELGRRPGDGVEVTTTATGELTLRGVTNPVTFDLTAEQRNGRIGVLGSIPVVFADYSIANPSMGGISTEDDGLLEFVLVLEPA